MDNFQVRVLATKLDCTSNIFPSLIKTIQESSADPRQKYELTQFLIWMHEDIKELHKVAYAPEPEPTPKKRFFRK
jgi:hypothetical protein